MTQQRPTALLTLRTLCRAGIALAVVYLATPAQAANLTVNTVGDEDTNNGLCSLREAIKAANQDSPYNGCDGGSGADNIWLQDPGDHWVDFSTPLLVTSEIRIDSNQSWINGSPSAAGFEVAAGGILTILWTNVGGFRVASSPTLKVNHGELHLMHARVHNNGDPNTILAQSFGIWNNGGYVTVHDSDISNNHGIKGAGILNTELGYVYVENSTIAFNASRQYGGGVATLTGAYTYLVNTTVSGNSSQSTPSSMLGQGGGLYNGDGSTTWAVYGTIANNRANHFGGALFNVAGASLALFGSIVDGNVTNNATPTSNCHGTIDSWGGNLVNPSNTCAGLTPQSSLPDLKDQGAQLGPLTQYNWWEPPIHKPLFTSPVINFIPTNDCWLSNDQVFTPRPTGSGCDIGAIEFTP